MEMAFFCYQYGVKAPARFKKKKGDTHFDRYVRGLTYGESSLQRGTLTTEMEERLRKGKESFCPEVNHDGGLVPLDKSGHVTCEKSSVKRHVEAQAESPGQFLSCSKCSGAGPINLGPKATVTYFTEPFIGDIFNNRTYTENSMTSPTELEELMQATHNPSNNITIEIIDMQRAIDPSEYAEETILPLVCEKRVNIGDDQEVYTGEPSKNQLVILDEPLPITSDDSLSEEAIDDRASLWVQANVLKLSRLFGAAFEGCDKTAFELFLKIDQKRDFLKQNTEKHINGNNSINIPKEVKNLAFNVNFKDGEQRSRGKKQLQVINV
ncbi:hypothetical protein KY284_029937 [Solanum tuberosum]|nr:hypothetical protein KY284_029937 [Solanum tuberosum]